MTASNEQAGPSGQSEALKTVLAQYRRLGIADAIDYDKFYLYSLITHSTAIEGSTVTEIENRLLFDEGITAKEKTLVEQMMNIDLKAAYERSMVWARGHEPFSIGMLKALSALAMRNTGSKYSTLMGEFDSAKGELRRVNVTAGFGGRSYMNHMKVEKALGEFCADLNELRSRVDGQDAFAKYLLSIDAHYRLLTIHPWVDGNGRMARLVMNMLQFEYGLIPIKVTKEHKAEYIEALERSRDEETLEPFRCFMIEEHVRNLQAEIARFKKGVEVDVPQNVPQINRSLQEGILSMIAADCRVTRRQMADAMNVSTKTIARELGKMPQIVHVGPAKGGHWEIKADV